MQCVTRFSVCFPGVRVHQSIMSVLKPGGNRFLDYNSKPSFHEEHSHSTFNNLLLGTVDCYK